MEPSRLYKPAWILLLLAGLTAAWWLRFVQDDTFISFHYARALVEGEGLTWFGQRVEGYTNFLWVLWMALGILVGIAPVVWSHVATLTSFALLLVAVHRFGRWVGPGTSLLAATLFVSNYTILRYATGGLETMPQTAVLTWAALLAWEERTRDALSPRRLTIISLLCAAALLLRLDSAVGVAWVTLLLMSGERRSRERSRILLHLALPLLVIVGSWLIWKLFYYGTFLPNTFVAKLGSRPLDTQGLTFLGRFFQWYMLWPVALAGLAAGAWRRRMDPLVQWMIGFVAAWCAYVLWVGGDFMEFRFMVPAAPFLFLSLAWLVLEPLDLRPRWRLATGVVVLAFLAFFSVRHGARFQGFTRDMSLDSIPALSTFYGLYPDERWDTVGTKLAKELQGTKATLAIHAAGAVPYYSRLKTIDMWGLNDAWIARHGNTPPPSLKRPGHYRHATLEYLAEQGVNFILGHPTTVPLDILGYEPKPPALTNWFVSCSKLLTGGVVTGATLVIIPLDGQMGLLTWYVTPSTMLDERILRRRWPRRTIRDW